MSQPDRIPSPGGVVPGRGRGPEADADAAAARLLLEGARPANAPDRSAELREALVAVDRAGAGDRLLELGALHGVLALLAGRVEELPREALGDVSAPLVDRLGRWRRDLSLRNLRLLAVLGTLAETLERQGAPVLAFKGPVLASTVYPDLGFRPFVDLDLLVAGEHRDAALRTLRARGFEPRKAVDPGPPDDAYAVALLRERDGCKVDLHWRLAPAHRALSPDPAEIRRRAGRIEIQDRLVRVPSVEDHLLLLAVHGAKHGPRPWPKLKWIADVAWLLDRCPDADWATALERARASGSGRALLLAVGLARELLGTEPPPELASALRSDRHAADLAREVAGRLFLPFDAPEPLLRRVGFDWRVLERRRDRLAYLGRRLFLPTGRDRDDPLGGRLPRPLLFVYRWARLVATYLREPSRLIRHFG